MPEGVEAPEAGSSSGSPEDGGGSSQPPDGGSFDFGGMGFGGFSLGGGGADLNYTGDDLDSYSTIWEGEITKTKDADHKRVVTALKNISEGTDLASYMDIDNLLRYMAVHIFSVNEDSLSGMMAHNYYLYEYDGQLNIIPWDYNLALGGMSGSNATSVVNEAIDNAFSGTEFFDTLMENEAYHQQYYAYMTQLVEEYINGGGFDAFYDRVRSQIDALVETDPNAFYTYEEYLTAAETLYEVVQLRGESISGQLERHDTVHLRRAVRLRRAHRRLPHRPGRSWAAWTSAAVSASAGRTPTETKPILRHRTRAGALHCRSPSELNPAALTSRRSRESRRRISMPRSSGTSTRPSSGILTRPSSERGRRRAAKALRETRLSPRTVLQTQAQTPRVSRHRKLCSNMA